MKTIYLYCCCCRCSLPLFQSLCRWSREFLFNPDLNWVLHIRCDSSPQFSKDYLVAECDYVSLENVYPLQPDKTLSALTWSTRVLPVQVLGRKATSAPYKFKSLLRMLHLETGNIEVACRRTVSFLNDMGVESKLALIPSLDQDLDGRARRTFENSLPLHDLDHAIHHCMEEIGSAWNHELFSVFESQLNTLAKYFSKSDNLERFRFHFILHNNKIDSEGAKRSINKMFLSACPTFVKHRWGYRYEVLKWMSSRSEFLMWLDHTAIGEPRSADNNFGDPDYVFSDAELRCLSILYTDKTAAACFWSLVNAMRLLCEWGHSLSGWLQGCYCHPTKEDTCQSSFNLYVV